MGNFLLLRQTRRLQYIVGVKLVLLLLFFTRLQQTLVPLLLPCVILYAHGKILLVEECLDETIPSKLYFLLLRSLGL